MIPQFSFFALLVLQTSAFVIVPYWTQFLKSAPLQSIQLKNQKIQTSQIFMAKDGDAFSGILTFFVAFFSNLFNYFICIY